MSNSLCVIGIDPSFTGTGIALVSDGLPVYVTTSRLGKFTDADKGKQLVRRIRELYVKINQVCAMRDVTHLIVERTDWMRNLNGNQNWKKEYAIERRNQEALALLQGAIAGYCIRKDLELMLIGVNEWHREFGAGNKDAVMALLWQEYPDAIEYRDEDYYWVAGDCPSKLNNNETDALGIALVGYNRIKQEMMVTP